MNWAGSRVGPRFQQPETRNNKSAQDATRQGPNVRMVRGRPRALNPPQGGTTPGPGRQQGGSREGLATGSSARVDAGLQTVPQNLVGSTLLWPPTTHHVHSTRNDAILQATKREQRPNNKRAQAIEARTKRNQGPCRLSGLRDPGMFGPGGSLLGSPLEVIRPENSNFRSL